jgi:adenine C2-methylase RlmN of 23S rRNA A2503 and tRNA A37
MPAVSTSSRKSDLWNLNMLTLQRSARGIIYPESGAQFIAHFFDGGASAFLPATLYQKSMLDGCIFAMPAQKGCSIGCSFCSVPAFVGDLDLEDLKFIMQLLVSAGAANHIDLKGRNKISFVKGGELFQNKYFSQILPWIQAQETDVKISTVFAATKLGAENVTTFMQFCATFPPDVQVGLQFSALSTDELTRQRITRFPLLSLQRVGEIAREFHGIRGRKMTVSFTAANDLKCDPAAVVKFLPSTCCAIRIYPYKQNGKRLQPITEDACRRLEQLFGEIGYSIIPCHNEYERKELGYFDESNPAMKLHMINYGGKSKAASLSATT